MKLFLSGLGLATVLSLSTVYASDCSTSFDQSCLATRYNRSQVERDQATRAAGITAHAHAQAVQAEIEAHRVERARIERRYQESLQAIRASSAEREQRYQERRAAIEKEYDASWDRGFFGRSARRSWPRGHRWHR